MGLIRQRQDEARELVRLLRQAESLAPRRGPTATRGAVGRGTGLALGEILQLTRKTNAMLKPSAANERRVLRR